MNLSMRGLIGVVVYYRAKNQASGWARKCEAACNHATTLIADDRTGELKGRRQELYNKAVLYGVIFPEQDYIHDLELITTQPMHDRPFVVLSAEDDEWLISNDPAVGYTVDPVKCVTEITYPVLGHPSFPIAIALYIIAQTLRALRRCSLGIIIGVLASMVPWIVDMTRNLVPMYKKLRD